MTSHEAPYDDSVKQPDFSSPEAVAAREADHDEIGKKIGVGFHDVVAGMAPYLRRGADGRLEYTGPDTNPTPSSDLAGIGKAEPLFELPTSDAKTIGRQLKPSERRAAGAIPGIMALRHDERIPTVPEDWERLKPVNLRQVLWHNKRSTNDDYVVDGVALTPREYRTIVRDVGGVVKKVGAVVLASRMGIVSNKAASESESRAQIGALTSYAETHATVAVGMQEKADRLEKLLGYLKQPGKALTTEAELRVLSTEAFIEFEGILEIAGRQYGLKDEQQQQLRNALIKSLSTGPQASRIETWTQMTTLAGQYTRRKKVLFADRAEKLSSAREKLLAKQ